MAPTAHSRLAPFVQRALWALGWEELRPVQQEAIEALATDPGCDLLIVSPTASGKTEAAFLPILSDIDGQAEDAVRVLYIAPLKALINDQWTRLGPLCERGGIAVHRWHGDVAQARKRRLLERPGGILQITPEAIEAQLMRNPQAFGALLQGLRWVVVDEVHAFAGEDRGVQLSSLLQRISDRCEREPRRVGLSATVGDSAVMRRWLRPADPDRVRVVSGETGARREHRYRHDHAVQEGRETPAAAVDTLARMVRGRSAIIFCNQRSLVEDLTVRLNRGGEEGSGGDERFLAHHGSLSRESREWVEERMRSGAPTVAVATSTLELGIDIGSLDLVVQVNAAPTVTGLAQRAGRSGRRAGDPARLLTVTFDPDGDGADSPADRLPFNLLHAAAVADLWLVDHWLEPPRLPRAAVNVLLQQILSLLVEHGGATEADLQRALRRARCFDGVDAATWRAIVDHLLARRYLERVPGPQGTLIVGLEAERLTGGWRVYSVFEESTEYAVHAGGRRIGSVAPQHLFEGAPIVLGGRPWRIVSIDHPQRMIVAERWADARAPRWVGGRGAPVAAEVALRARGILCGDREPPGLGDVAADTLTAARRVAVSAEMERRGWFPAEAGAGAGRWLPWGSGHAVAAALARLRVSGVRVEEAQFPWLISLRADDLAAACRAAVAVAPEAVAAALPEQLLAVRTYDEYLPRVALQRRWLVDEDDPAGARALLEGLVDEAG